MQSDRWPTRLRASLREYHHAKLFKSKVSVSWSIGLALLPPHKCFWHSSLTFSTKQDLHSVLFHISAFIKKNRHNIFTHLVANFVPGCKVQNDWLHIIFKAHFDCNNCTMKNGAQLFNSNCKPLSGIFLRTCSIMRQRTGYKTST